MRFSPQRARALLRAVGRRMAEIRQFRGWTQEEAAERIGWTPGGYARYEQGRKNVTVTTLARIAAMLDTDVATLFEPPTTTTKKGRPKKRR